MLKVFEAFAGYGSQRMALRNMGINFEVVGISEIEGDVIQSYAAIHTDYLKLRNKFKEEAIDKNVMINFLEEINVPLDYKTFENKAKKLSETKLKDIFLANKLINNYGDIKLIKAENLPDFDLFTYSFPCQDISVAGYQKGLKKDSDTRSSLLWECCKIIECKKPKYLLMENVKNLVGSRHKTNFLEFLSYLESLGYSNKWAVLNARDFNIPQNRERVFCISVLGDNDFEFPDKVELEKTLKDILEEDVEPRFYLNNNQFLKNPIIQDYSYCIDSNYWKGTTLKSFLEKKRRQLVTTNRKNEEGLFIPRKLTPKECWRLMGVNDEDFNKASQVVSSTALYRQAGNSIVVPVLEAIFLNLFKNEYSSRTSKNIAFSLSFPFFIY